MVSRRKILGLLIALGTLALLAAAGLFLGNRTSAPVPILPPGDLSRVTIRLDDLGDLQKPATIASDDAGRISVLATVLRKNRSSEDHKCSSTGELVIWTGDGRVTS